MSERITESRPQGHVHPQLEGLPELARSTCTPRAARPPPRALGISSTWRPQKHPNCLEREAGPQPPWAQSRSTYPNSTSRRAVAARFSRNVNAGNRKATMTATHRPTDTK